MEDGGGKRRRQGDCIALYLVIFGDTEIFWCVPWSKGVPKNLRAHRAYIVSQGLNWAKKLKDFSIEYICYMYNKLYINKILFGVVC